jgi:hypothetical protein
MPRSFLGIPTEATPRAVDFKISRRLTFLFTSSPQFEVREPLVRWRDPLDSTRSPTDRQLPQFWTFQNIVVDGNSTSSRELSE